MEEQVAIGHHSERLEGFSEAQLRLRGSEACPKTERKIVAE